MPVTEIETSKISMQLRFFRPMGSQAVKAPAAEENVTRNLVARLEGRLQTDSRYGRLSDALSALQPLFQKLDGLTESIRDLQLPLPEEEAAQPEPEEKTRVFLKRELAALPLQPQAAEPVLEQEAARQQLQQEPAALEHLNSLKAAERARSRQLTKQAHWQRDTAQAGRFLDQLAQAQQQLGQQTRQLNEVGTAAPLPHALNISPLSVARKQVG